jgi:hypothetical protein
MALRVKSNFLSLAGLFLSSRGIQMESYKKKKTIFFYFLMKKNHLLIFKSIKRHYLNINSSISTTFLNAFIKKNQKNQY